MPADRNRFGLIPGALLVVTALIYGGFVWTVAATQLSVLDPNGTYGSNAGAWGALTSAQQADLLFTYLPGVILLLVSAVLVALAYARDSDTLRVIGISAAVLGLIVEMVVPWWALGFDTFLNVWFVIALVLGVIAFLMVALARLVAPAPPAPAVP